MSSNMKVLEAMIAASKRKDHEAFLDTMTDDLEYHWKIGVRPIRGKATMRKFLNNYEASFDQREWVITNWAEKNDTLMVEGVEKVYDRTREVLIDNPFMQSIEFRDGKVCKLRDYYDSALISAPAREPAAAEPQSAPEPKIETIRRLQQAIAAKDKAGFLEFFAPEVEYHYHVGSRSLIGLKWIEKFITKYWADNSGATWIIEHHAETGTRLLTEGREEYVNASGQTVRHPYMGIIDFRADGKIVGWRDYFQMADPNATH